jgi:hypothetical protein
MVISRFVTDTGSAEQHYDEVTAVRYAVPGGGAAGAVFGAWLSAPHATLAVAAFINARIGHIDTRDVAAVATEIAASPGSRQKRPRRCAQASALARVTGCFGPTAINGRPISSCTETRTTGAETVPGTSQPGKHSI